MVRTAAVASRGETTPGGCALPVGRQGQTSTRAVSGVAESGETRQWGVPTWLVKLDVRKAFDSVWQESMGDMVAQRVGGLKRGKCRWP